MTKDKFAKFLDDNHDPLIQTGGRAALIAVVAFVVIVSIGLAIKSGVGGNNYRDKWCHGDKFAFTRSGVIVCQRADGTLWTPTKQDTPQ